MIPVPRLKAPFTTRGDEDPYRGESAPAAPPSPGSGFLLLHGWQNRRTPGHWLHWLAGELADRGHQVAFPQLPDPDQPRLELWMAATRNALESLDRQRRTVVCHSLSCLAWLHLAASASTASASTALPVDRVALVAPPGRAFLRETKELTGFALGRRAGRASIAAMPIGARSGRLVCSHDDRYCAEGADRAYAAARLDVDLLPGQGHLDMEAGYGRWPGMLAWCLDERSRIAARDEAIDITRVDAPSAMQHASPIPL